MFILMGLDESINWKLIFLVILCVGFFFVNCLIEVVCDEN